ncbi:MAG: tetratricopeptide repeat protein, partial [Bacteroidota bacterium]
MRKPFALFLLTVLNLTVFAQTKVDSLDEYFFQKGDQLATAGKYDSAEIFLLKSRDAAYQLKHWENFTYAQIRYASIPLNKGNYAEAVERAKVARDTLEKHLGTDNTLLAEVYRDIAGCYGDLQTDSTLHYANKALAIQLRTLPPDHPDFAGTYNNIGSAFANQEEYQQALEYYLKALDIKIKDIGPEHPNVALYYNNVGYSYSMLGDYERQLAYYNKARNVRAKALGEFHPKMFYTYNNLGSAYFNRGYMKKGKEYFLKGLEVCKKNNFSSSYLKSMALHNLASVHHALGDVQQAVEYINQAVRTLQEEPEANRQELEVAYSSLGGYLKQAGRISEAKNALLTVVEMRGESDKFHKVRSVKAYQNLAELAIDEKEWDQAIAYLDQAEEAFRNVFGRFHSDLVSVYQVQGQVYFLRGEWDQAIERFQLCLMARRQTIGLFSPRNAEIHCKIAKTFHEMEQLDSALYHYQSALVCLDSATTTMDNRSFPDFSTNVWPKIMGEALLGKAKVLGKMAGAEPELLPLTYKSYQLALALIDVHRTEPFSDDAKRNISEQTLPAFEDMIEICFSLYEKEGKGKWLQEAYFYSEKSKASLLHQSLQESDARRFAGMPDSILHKEEELRSSMLYYQQKVIETDTLAKGKDADKLSLWREKAIDYKNQYNKLVSQLEIDYPAYYQLKYDLKVTEPEVLAKSIPSNTGLVEYFVGDKETYVFFIGTEGLQGLRLGRLLNLEEDIRNFRQSITQRHLETQSVSDQQDLQFTDLGYRLYQKIFAPLTEAFDLPERLIIIPDGALGYLPFDVILSEKTSEKDLYQAHPYLLRQHAIGYAYSATLFHKTQIRPSQDFSEKMIAFAPLFENGIAVDPQYAVRSIDNLQPLPYSREEVESICQLLKGKVLLGEEASEERFKALAPRYQIIHLSSHAAANDARPMLSEIAFSEQ